MLLLLSFLISIWQNSFRYVDTLFHHSVYHYTYTGEILIDTGIRYTKHSDSSRLKERRPCLIITESMLIIMLRTVNLNCKQRLMAKEIHNVAANRLLPLKAYRIVPQKIIP